MKEAALVGGLFVFALCAIGIEFSAAEGAERYAGAERTMTESILSKTLSGIPPCPAFLHHGELHVASYSIPPAIGGA